MDPTLILFSGLPGSGKTTLARQLATLYRLPLLSKDRVQRALRDHVPGAEAINGYHLILDLADEQLGLGLSVILDAVFPLPGFREAAHAIAARHAARLRVIACACSDRALWQARCADRTQYVPGWNPAGWSEVERLEPVYQPWLPDAALHVDAVRPTEANLALIRTFLET
ncbi:MAG: AAA family ATPase [Anaerolineae bacterium]|nr:AAA family ATPase [Anaerolineae bacterium]